MNCKKTKPSDIHQIFQTMLFQCASLAALSPLGKGQCERSVDKAVQQVAGDKAGLFPPEMAKCETRLIRLQKPSSHTLPQSCPANISAGCSEGTPSCYCTLTLKPYIAITPHQSGMQPGWKAEPGQKTTQSCAKHFLDGSALRAGPLQAHTSSSAWEKGGNSSLEVYIQCFVALTK